MVSFDESEVAYEFGTSILGNASRERAKKTTKLNASRQTIFRHDMSSFINVKTMESNIYPMLSQEKQSVSEPVNWNRPFMLHFS